MTDLSRPNWLPVSTSERFVPGDRKFSYSLDELRGLPFELRELPGGWLVLKRDEFWIRFAVLEFATSDTDDANEFDHLLFYGEGPGGALRECRHTYWGEDGYIFYPNGVLISAAFRELSEFFDELVPEEKK